MDKGLKIGLCVLGIGCLIPIITTFMTLKNKPLYHTAQPEVEACFVQYTWQEKPVLNLEHILIFLEKPEDYIAKSGVDMFPPEKTNGYYVLPRAVFYQNGNILASMQKVFRMSKKDVRTWIIIKGKAFPLELSQNQLKELTGLIAAEKDHLNVSPQKLGKSLIKSKVWQVIIEDVEDKRAKLAAGKLDLKPHKKRSDFMR